MSMWWKVFEETLSENGLLVALAIVGLISWVSQLFSDRITNGRLHASAVAIAIGLGLAAIAGYSTEGRKGLADISIFSGLSLLGGSMIRDLAIVSTAYGARPKEFWQGGGVGAFSLAVGLTVSFFVGTTVAWVAGYDDAESITTIGAGTATYIVGPVTGTAIGASSEVIALSVAAGLIKAISVMLFTPFLARRVGLDNPRAAMAFGGLMGTNSGVMAGLAATDPKLVPYGAMTATFYTGIGCLLGPSLVYMLVRWIVV